MALRGVTALRQNPATARDLTDARLDIDAPKPTLGRRLRWIVLSFAPSSLLLGVTTYVTTDLASVPLLWVLPLSLYLITFILAYRRDSWGSSAFLVKRQGFLLLAAAITFFARATEPAVILLPLHLLAFFVTGLVCHTELAKDDRNQLSHRILFVDFFWRVAGRFFQWIPGACRFFHSNGISAGDGRRRLGPAAVGAAVRTVSKQSHRCALAGGAVFDRLRARLVDARPPGLIGLRCACFDLRSVGIGRLELRAPAAYASA